MIKRKLKKSFMKKKKMQNLSDNEKEEIYDHLVELVNTFDKKEEYKQSDRDDLDYFGIKKLEIYLVVLIMMIIITS